MKYNVLRYSIEQLEPGLVIANAITLEVGSTVLLAEKAVLTQSMINKIRECGIGYVDVMKPHSTSWAIEMAQEELEFSIDHNRVFESTKQIFTNIQISQMIPSEEVSALAGEIVDKLLNFPQAMCSLQKIKRFDAYTYTHSTNVGILSGVIAKWAGFDDVKNYVLAGLLHDVGRTQIPWQILSKPGRLNAEETRIMQTHSLIGWRIAKNARLPKSVLDAILSHHERIDGSGYPNNYSGEDVSLAARVVALADTFDAMTSHRVYQNAVTPFHVMQEIYYEMFVKLDPKLSLVFLQKLRDQLTGSLVGLRNGMRARVVHIDETQKYEPILQSLEGQLLLQNCQEFSIVEIIH